MPWPKSSYCNECSREMIRYRYPFLSNEQKIKWMKRSIAWGKRNPDKVRITCRRASAKWYKKKQIEMLRNTTYQIRVNGYSWPKGSILKAIAYLDGKIIFSGGIAVKRNHVRKVSLASEGRTR